MKLYSVIYDDYDATKNILMEEKDYKILHLLEKYHINFTRLNRDVVLEVNKVIKDEDNYLEDVYYYYLELFEMYGFNKDVDIDSKEVDTLRERYEELKSKRTKESD